MSSRQILICQLSQVNSSTSFTSKQQLKCSEFIYICSKVLTWLKNPLVEIKDMENNSIRLRIDGLLV